MNYVTCTTVLRYSKGLTRAHWGGLNMEPRIYSLFNDILILPLVAWNGAGWKQWLCSVSSPNSNPWSSQVNATPHLCSLTTLTIIETNCKIVVCTFLAYRKGPSEQIKSAPFRIKSSSLTYYPAFTLLLWGEMEGLPSHCLPHLPTSLT